jgi:glycosyltransferase involved in cell wall biosynthesis
LVKSMQAKVLMIPKNHEYIKMLRSSLGKIGIDVKVLKPFHYSSLANIVKILFFRVKGWKIVHVHWLYIFPFRIVMKGFYYLCKLMGIRIIWEMHNIVPHNYNGKDVKNSKWFYEKSDAIIFHSERDIDRSKEILRTNINKMHIVIPHGNFHESYENRINKKEARRILDIPENIKVILCFGFIRKNRGYEYLIEATKDMEDTIVVIAGKMEDRNVYQKLVEHKSKVPNLRLYAKWIPDDELQVYFNACDIVALPYTRITTSGVIPLAYSFSRPVVTSNIGGLKDVVNDNTGIIVPPEDADALRKAIEKIFTMEYWVMGRYAYEYARREFSWESNAQRIKELYEQIANSN